MAAVASTTTLLGVRFASPLDRDLASVGLSALPADLAKAHEKRYLGAMRLGVWKYLWPIARGVFHLMTVGTLMMAAGVWGLFFWIAYGFALVLEPNMGLPALPDAFGRNSFLLAFAGVALYGLVYSAIVKHSSTAFGLACQSRWRLVPYQEYQKARHIPDRQLLRIRAAQRILFAKVYVKYLDTDPFIVVRQGWSERVIGAWNTGTDLDNM